MRKERAEKRERLELEGEVVDTNHGIFKVRIGINDTEDKFITCQLSGKIRQRSIKIVVGDRVKIEVSEYDTLKGRIVYRK